MTDQDAGAALARDRSNSLYDRVAAIYAAWVRMGSLGAFPGLYRQGAAALDLTPGQTVLDMCCGTGELFPYLRQAVGPDGWIVGCDLNAAMLEHARDRAARLALPNVELVHGDALSFRPARPIDAAIFSICLSAIPWRLDVLDHVIGLLPGNASVVIIDSLALPGRPIANLYNRAKGRLIGADPDCGLRGAAQARLRNFKEQQVAGGVYSLLVGRTP